MSLDLVISRLEKLDDKLERLVETQTQIRVDLNEHIRRTEIAEKRLDRIDADLQPIINHVHTMQTAGWLIVKVAAVIATVVGLAFAGLEILLKVIGKE